MLLLQLIWQMHGSIVGCFLVRYHPFACFAHCNRLCKRPPSWQGHMCCGAVGVTVPFFESKKYRNRNCHYKDKHKLRERAKRKHKRRLQKAAELTRHALHAGHQPAVQQAVPAACSDSGNQVPAPSDSNPVLASPLNGAGEHGHGCPAAAGTAVHADAETTISAEVRALLANLSAFHPLVTHLLHEVCTSGLGSSRAMCQPDCMTAMLHDTMIEQVEHVE